MPYCENCGTEVNPNASFCRKCGAAINVASMMSPPPPPPPPPSSQSPPKIPLPTPARESSSEGTLGVMLLRKPKSLGRYDSFTGVLTTHRMIFAQMTSEMLKDAIKLAREQAKAEGKGFWGQWSDQLKASFSYSQKYLTMTPSAILSETQGNFAVNNDTIHEIKMKLKHTRQGNMDLHEFEMEIKTNSGKFEFRMDENGEYVNLLKQAYGEKVKMPLGYFSSHGVKIHF
jgi:hypothetical protein